MVFIKNRTQLNDRIKTSSFFLRSGIATVFLYAAIASFLQPDAWVGFFPFWLRNLISENILLILFSIYQLVLAGWLLSGKKIIFAAELSGLTLLSIIVANYGFLDVLFRDIAILFSAIGLIALHWGE